MPTRDKIHISKDKAVVAIYEKLTSDVGPVPTKPFRYDREVFLASVLLGFRNGARQPLDVGSRQEKFTWSTLLNDETALPVLRAIAYSVTKDPAVILDDDRVATVAEEFANAGIHLLAKQVLETELDELREVLLLMSKGAPTAKEDP